MFCFTKRPVLIGMHGGERSKKLEKISDIKLVEKIMANFSIIYGDNLPLPTFFKTTKWGQDPFSFGSYSYVPTGACGEDYKGLARSIKNILFFAGEATSVNFPATMHGAYLSGIREAEKIIELAKLKYS